MFIEFYIVKIVYICVFMTCSTASCLCDTLIYPWNVCIYVCVCMYVFYKYIITILLLRNRENFSNLYFCYYAVVALRITINS
jgi:hypothetical protein